MNAIQQLEELKNKYPPIIKPNDTYKTRSNKINDLRKGTKKILNLIIINRFLFRRI
ncbi:hypothetical protein LCGC14_1009020 [marine sediment metagenome]|uniref:Uncharacterized protein n=1 Tax=marine sediment metagenome TaxID=412755 RepID=A0A0F9N5A6_9ZZZZ